MDFCEAGISVPSDEGMRHSVRHQIRFHSVVGASLHQRNLAAFSPATFAARHRLFPGSCTASTDVRGWCLPAKTPSRCFATTPFSAHRECAHQLGSTGRTRAASFKFVTGKCFGNEVQLRTGRGLDSEMNHCCAANIEGAQLLL